MNKLDITLSQFKKMRAVDRDEIIYQNLVHIKKKLGDYKLHKKIQYIWLALLSVFVGIKKYLGI
ncbi:MAG: hypothetical protein E3J56_01005 [Candidatus Aminicenantes bacterium]|nr:MAG: hypothetical protein E3J56_01005 [Candidatus Aminicenantes bacterium]